LARKQHLEQLVQQQQQQQQQLVPQPQPRRLFNNTRKKIKFKPNHVLTHTFQPNHVLTHTFQPNHVLTQNSNNRTFKRKLILSNE
jgi:hypothetical protein